MSGTLGVTEIEDTAKPFCKSENCVQKEITLADPAADLPKYTLLAVHTTNYNYEPYDPAGANGLNKPVCILGEDIVDPGAEVKSWAWFAGKYNADLVVWPTVTTAQKNAALLALIQQGVFVDEFFG